MQRLEFKAAFTATDDGTVEGIAWPYGSTDLVGDQIDAKAFEGAAAPLPMLFQHDEPVGVWDEIKSTADGLVMKGRLLINSVARAAEARSLIVEKAIQGLSIGFVTEKAVARKGGGRLISKLSLKECSLVAIPCNPGARITLAKELTYMTTENTAIDTAAIDAKLAGVETKLAARLDAIEAKSNRLAADNDNEPDGELETKALNSWLKTGQVDAELKTLVVGTPASGGYTVAPEYSTNVIKKIAELSPIRQLASVMGIGTGKVYIPTLATDAATGWTTEVATRTTTEPTFGQVEIDVFEQYCIVPISRILLEDSMIDLAGFLADRMAVKFAQSEATSFVSGSGTGQPTGILAALASFEQIEADQDGSDILDKLVDAFYALPAEYAERGTWAMNRRTAGLIRKAADVSSSRGSIWSDGIAGGTPATLLGAPVSYWTDLDDLLDAGSPAADTTPVLFGDFASAYQIVDRVPGIDILKDEYTGADTGVVKFRARRRVGGKTVLPEAVVAVVGAAA